MSALVLLRPLWLLALVPILLAAWFARRRRLAGGWEGVIDPELMEEMHRLGLVIRGGRSATAALPFAGAALLALALSGPALPRKGQTEFRALDQLILVLDLSPSVVADPRVLGQMQSGAAELLGLAAGRPVGLMAYAADAYLVSAPTSDASSLQGLIAVLARDTIPVSGSRPDIALSMARDFFGTDGPGLGGADLIFLTDGGGLGVRATEEAERLATDGARIWALALPAVAQGAPPADLAGLRALTAAGGGEAFPLAEAPALIDRISRARTARMAREDVAGQGFRDFGPLLLPLAMLALLPLFRRRR